MEGLATWRQQQLACEAGQGSARSAMPASLLVYVQQLLVELLDLLHTTLNSQCCCTAAHVVRCCCCCCRSWCMSCVMCLT
jgi:hypothetical protein